jgi:hypothetical protein
MKTGDTVQFKDGLYKDELGARYKVVEINGDRAIIEFMCDLPIPPQSVAMISELEIVHEERGDIQSQSAREKN